jgi:hypothetical protein
MIDAMNVERRFQGQCGPPGGTKLDMQREWATSHSLVKSPVVTELSSITKNEMHMSGDRTSRAMAVSRLPTHSTVSLARQRFDQKLISFAMEKNSSINLTLASVGLHSPGSMCSIDTSNHLVQTSQNTLANTANVTVVLRVSGVLII